MATDGFGQPCASGYGRGVKDRDLWRNGIAKKAKALP
jgi:hypothetical protein